MVTKEQFKLYARIDHDDEDELIAGLIAAAENAVYNMTGKKPPHGTDELYDIAVLQFATHLYENRTPVETGISVNAVPFTLQTLLSHIAFSDYYPEGGLQNDAGE